MFISFPEQRKHISLPLPEKNIFPPLLLLIIPCDVEHVRVRHRLLQRAEVRLLDPAGGDEVAHLLRHAEARREHVPGFGKR